MATWRRIFAQYAGRLAAALAILGMTLLVWEWHVWPPDPADREGCIYRTPFRGWFFLADKGPLMSEREGKHVEGYEPDPSAKERLSCGAWQLGGPLWRLEVFDDGHRWLRVVYITGFALAVAGALLGKRRAWMLALGTLGAGACLGFLLGYHAWLMSSAEAFGYTRFHITLGPGVYLTLAGFLGLAIEGVVALRRRVRRPA